MDLLQFHKMRTAVQGNAYPGSGRDLTSMEGTLRDLLLTSGVFDEVEVEHTDDPDQLVIALCHFKPDLSERDVAQLIERLWEQRVRYPFWEAHAVLVGEEHVEFEAATRNSTGGHYVTVHLVAQRAPVPAQRGRRD
ncbi:hypothetical protein [Nocardioides jiangsuensis]|uniref:hypothetical protein n=1 Tax=Nocardioides jiangsuensis TaxID=2866161 RepID=UPI001CED3A0E|nr:hypothetical protein [Nocardioides jiangsuensis]